MEWWFNFDLSNQSGEYARHRVTVPVNYVLLRNTYIYTNLTAVHIGIKTLWHLCAPHTVVIVARFPLHLRLFLQNLTKLPIMCKVTCE